MPRSTAADRCGGSRSRPAWRSTSRRATRLGGACGVDLVVVDLVAGALELDRAEQELGRALPRARRVEPREPAREVDEGDPHRSRRLPPQGPVASSTLLIDAPSAHEALEARQPGRVVRRASRDRRDVRDARPAARQPELTPPLFLPRPRAGRDAAPDRRVARPRGVRLASLHRPRGGGAVAGDRRAGRRIRRRDRARARRGRQRQGAARQGVRRRGHTASRASTLGPDDPWFSFCASRRMLDVANAYLRLWSKLSYVDLWYTAQQPATDERVASQNWHVDFDDKHLLKAFVYLTDVGPDHGPFEYVPGSQPGGRHHAVRPWKPMGYGRVPDEDVATQRSRAARSRRSPARRERSSSATRAACTAAASPRPGRACSRRRRTARRRRWRRSRTATTRTTLETTDAVVGYAVS